MTAWSFNIQYMFPSTPRKAKTWVYSDTGKDIEERFYPHIVKNIRKIKDPLKDIAFTGWGKKKETKYI